MTNPHQTIKLDLSLLTDTAVNPDENYASSVLDSLLYNNLSEQTGAGLFSNVFKKVATEAKSQVVEAGKNSLATIRSKSPDIIARGRQLGQSVVNTARTSPERLRQAAQSVVNTARTSPERLRQAAQSVSTAAKRASAQVANKTHQFVDTATSDVNSLFANHNKPDSPTSSEGQNSYGQQYTIESLADRVKKLEDLVHLLIQKQ